MIAFNAAILAFLGLMVWWAICNHRTHRELRIISDWVFRTDRDEIETLGFIQMLLRVDYMNYLWHRVTLRDAPALFGDEIATAVRPLLKRRKGAANGR